MSQLLRIKPIFLQSSLAFCDIDFIRAGQDPSVAFFQADAAIAFADVCDLRKLEGKLERPAMTVPVVCSQLGSWGEV